MIEFSLFQVIALIAPVDVAGTRDNVFETVQILENLALRSMVEERRVDDKTDCSYEYRLHPIMGNFLTRSIVNEHLVRKFFTALGMDSTSLRRILFSNMGRS